MQCCRDAHAKHAARSVPPAWPLLMGEFVKPKRKSTCAIPAKQSDQISFRPRDPGNGCFYKPLRCVRDSRCFFNSHALSEVIPQDASPFSYTFVAIGL